jgi:lipopolysaccharide/colanic/teichoic acid biosynthesis glycosyltransferase
MGLRRIHSAERFWSILEFERARSNRNGHQFSLVVFDIRNSESDNIRGRHLASVLANRIRSIDKAGWLDNERMGVLLPYTSAAGAWRLADDVCRTIDGRVSPPECAVYTYPSVWFPDNNGHSAQLYFRDISPAWEMTTSRNFFAPAKGVNIDSVRQQSQCNRTQNWGELVEDFEPFHINPLPVWKRAMDIFGALLGLILLSPLMLAAAVVIKIVSPGPAFFRQQRVGYMGKIFYIWKFRTMEVDADTSVHQEYLAKLINDAACNNGKSSKPMTKLDDDMQIIPFGRILRQTYFDELPQLLNVLRGEMSLVGPRPPIPYEVEEYLSWHKERIDVVPGMTGLWQVSGKNRLTFNEMVRLDVQYWRTKSVWLDIKILLKTPLAIISQMKDGLQNEQPQMKGVIENA